MLAREFRRIKTAGDGSSSPIRTGRKKKKYQFKIFMKKPIGDDRREKKGGFRDVGDDI